MTYVHRTHTESVNHAFALFESTDLSHTPEYLTPHKVLLETKAVGAKTSI
ncbi:hypothetical protein [Vibrio cidicii]|nr:hypothetical protein [Vibrio cidicii]